MHDLIEKSPRCINAMGMIHKDFLDLTDSYSSKERDEMEPFQKSAIVFFEMELENIADQIDKMEATLKQLKEDQADHDDVVQNSPTVSD
jgi:hypothetical protein